MMQTYDVSIKIPNAESHSDVIVISGTLSCVEEAKQALAEKIEVLEKEKEDRILKSYSVTVSSHFSFFFFLFFRCQDLAFVALPGV